MPPTNPSALGTRTVNGGIQPAKTPARQLTVPLPAQSGAKEPIEPSAAPIQLQSTVLVRKRLPWLDGVQRIRTTHVPGAFESKESVTMPDTAEVPSSAPNSDKNTPGDKPSTTPLERDPALRAVGSTPSLRQREKPGETRTLSLSSKVRTGLVAPESKEQAKQVLGIVNEQRGNVVSSEYSTTPSFDREEAPAKLAKPAASSYERLIDRQAAAEGGHRVNGQWLQSQFDLPLDEPSPRTTKQPAVLGGVDEFPHIKIKTRQHRQRAESCRSCDNVAPPAPPPKARTVTRRSFAVPPPQTEPPQSPIAPPGRKPTLFAMPDHLMGSSSSYSWDRPPQQTSRQTQALSQPPQQATLRRSSAPVTTTPSNRRESYALNRAVTGLENLMEEALSVARDAAQTGRNEEVATILNNATLALRNASTIHEEMDQGTMSPPFRLSPPESRRHGTDSDSIAPDSDASSTRSTRRSIDTAPTQFTMSPQPSQQPVLKEPYRSKDELPRSQNASFEDVRNRDKPPDGRSITKTPPRLYQPPSADSIVRDFAYAKQKNAKAEAARALSRGHGAAEEYYGDHGESIPIQPGVRPSFNITSDLDKPLPPLPLPTERRPASFHGDIEPPHGRRQHLPVRRMEPVATQTVPPRISSRSFDDTMNNKHAARDRQPRHHRPHHLGNLFESHYYHTHKPSDQPDRGLPSATEKITEKRDSLVTDSRYEHQPRPPAHEASIPHEESLTRYSGPATLLKRDISLRHPRRKHISLREGQGFSLGRYHRRKPIAREWNITRKRVTAGIACLNTVFVGLIAGIYAGEVPALQYHLADTKHQVILGNVVLFATLGIITIIFWPLPLLHGRKPYTLLSFALMLPLCFPQALAVSGYRSPYNPLYRCGLLIPRAFQGLAIGFANINFLPTLLDLFGASLMSDKPHQELVVYDDVRRQGGGIGVWLGIWSWCFVGSMSVGFCVGAVIISRRNPAWGFYVIVILLAFFLAVNVIAPETRRAPYRRSIAQFFEQEGGEERMKRRVARGEVKLHISNEGPKWWVEEVWAGIILTKRMVCQFGFFVLMFYLAWMYAQVTLVILLLGALLSRDYLWPPYSVGLATLSIALGALLATPLSKANLFSRARDRPQRTDSMTMRHARVTWSSHMLRRCLFTLTLPFAALAYTLSSPGPSVSWVTPTVFCGLVGFLSNLAIAECVGLIMETFDTCDLQPGVNQKHRLQSMAETTRRRRTNYSSFPRICAGFFAAQGLGFILSAAATGVSGDITRAFGAQTATAIVAAILLGVTVLFVFALWRWKELQVIPTNAFAAWDEAKLTGGKREKGDINWASPPGGVEDPDWRPVIIGNPSGKMRRMNFLELGSLSRWTEIRRLNKLVR